MNDALVWTVLIGGGLLVSGYALGYLRGMNTGTQSVMNELFKSGLLSPEKILAHYSREGNEKARALMAQLNQLKREQEKKEKDNG